MARWYRGYRRGGIKMSSILRYIASILKWTTILIFSGISIALLLIFLMIFIQAFTKSLVDVALISYEIMEYLLERFINYKGGQS